MPAVNLADDIEKGRLSRISLHGEPGQSWKATEVHNIPPNKLPIVFPALAFTLFLAALDSTIVATALPTVVSELGGEGAYSWIGTIYILPPACLAPLYGQLSDLIGRKQILLFSMAAFCVGSALCGAAQNYEWLVAGRAVQGLGGGGIFQFVMIVTSDITTLEERGKYSGGIAAAWSLASLAGPLIGGALAEHASWRYMFYLNIPPTLLAIALLYFFLKLNPTPKKSFYELIQSLDIVGMLLISAGTICLLLGFQFPSSSIPWNSPQVLSLLPLGLVLLMLAGYNEAVTKKQPILPSRLFRTRTTAGVLVGTFCMQFTYMSMAYYLPLYFQILGWSATLAGLLVVPYALGSALVAILAGYIITKQGKYKPVMIFGFAANTMGLGLMIILDENSNVALPIVFLLITATGLGCLLQSPNIAIQAAMPLQDMATSMTALFILRMIAGVLGISLGGAVYTSSIRSNLDAFGYQQPVGRRIDDIRDLIRIQPVELKDQVIRAYILGLRNFWILLTPISFVGLICILIIRSYSLKRTIVQATDDTVQTTIGLNLPARPPSAHKLPTGPFSTISSQITTPGDMTPVGTEQERD